MVLKFFEILQIQYLYVYQMYMQELFVCYDLMQAKANVDYFQFLQSSPHFIKLYTFYHSIGNNFNFYFRGCFFLLYIICIDIADCLFCFFKVFITLQVVLKYYVFRLHLYYYIQGTLHLFLPYFIPPNVFTQSLLYLNNFYTLPNFIYLRTSRFWMWGC